MPRKLFASTHEPLGAAAVSGLLGFGAALEAGRLAALTPEAGRPASFFGFDAPLLLPQPHGAAPLVCTPATLFGPGLGISAELGYPAAHEQTRGLLFEAAKFGEGPTFIARETRCAPRFGVLLARRFGHEGPSPHLLPRLLPGHSPGQGELGAASLLLVPPKSLGPLQICDPRCSHRVRARRPVVPGVERRTVEALGPVPDRAVDAHVKVIVVAIAPAHAPRHQLDPAQLVLWCLDAPTVFEQPLSDVRRENDVLDLGHRVVDESHEQGPVARVVEGEAPVPAARPAFGVDALKERLGHGLAVSANQIERHVRVTAALVGLVGREGPTGFTRQVTHGEARPREGAGHRRGGPAEEAHQFPGPVALAADRREGIPGAEGEGMLEAPTVSVTGREAIGGSESGDIRCAASGFGAGSLTGLLSLRRAADGDSEGDTET